MGIFHLESLRLRREKLHSSAITHLEEFNDELSNKLRRAMMSYIDIMHSTAMTSAQATEVARVAIDTIDADHDSECSGFVILSCAMEDFELTPTSDAFP